ncbi:MAG: carbon starvation CstA family protein [Oscillospiraceae bacterium]|nr:carbon starvation CstA family protein [Oscillospiraceae bacterium]
MNTLVIVLIAAVCLLCGYTLYGRWLANKWGIDPTAKTPAYTHEDGKDYVPTNSWTVFSHQFSSIAGAGPVTGAIQAAAFGWLPVLLWVLLGGIFFGAVTDFGALYASVKNEGKSMGLLIEKYIGKLFLLFCWLFCGIVIAAFADMVAGTFNAYAVKDGVTSLSAASQTNGAAGMVSIMFMVFAVVFGLIQKKYSFSGWKEAALGIVFIVLSFAVGANFPLVLSKAAWSYITFVYIFFAAVLPMWMMKQPRDYMTTFMFIGMIAGAAVGLLVAHPSMNLPVFTGFNNGKLGTMFPILFVTVACGAVSGFHSLVSSGTSSKTVENEKDMLKVGYGAMVLESLLAVLALCVAGAAAAADGTPAAGTPFQVFSTGVAGFFEMFGVPVYAATVFMTMCVSALALTSLDAVARIGRMSFQELFSVDDMAHAEGWRRLLCNTYFSTFVTLAFGFLLTRIGYANIWPLFGSANQLLSALVLVTLCVFLKVTGRSNKMLFPPLFIMLCVTFTALVQRLLAMVKAIRTAAAVTIPAGETTWGAVFIANGLQLIIAVLLIILGLTIVVNSLRALNKAEKNSEKAA